MKAINVNQINEIKNPHLIDVREKMEFESNSIKGAINVPLEQFMANPANYLKKDEENYIVCLSGGRSSMACQSAMAAGFNNVTNLTGGMMGYFGNL